MIRCSNCNQIFSNKSRLARHLNTQGGCKKSISRYN